MVHSFSLVCTSVTQQKRQLVGAALHNITAQLPKRIVLFCASVLHLKRSSVTLVDSLLLHSAGSSRAIFSALDYVMEFLPCSR